MKIYVTGLGVVSGIGLGVAENIASLRKHQHGMGKVTLFPTELNVPVSEVKYSNEELTLFRYTKNVFPDSLIRHVSCPGSSR